MQLKSGKSLRLLDILSGVVKRGRFEDSQEKNCNLTDALEKPARRGNVLLRWIQIFAGLSRTESEGKAAIQTDFLNLLFRCSVVILNVDHRVERIETSQTTFCTPMSPVAPRFPCKTDLLRNKISAYEFARVAAPPPRRHLGSPHCRHFPTGSNEKRSAWKLFHRCGQV